MDEDERADDQVPAAEVDVLQSIQNALSALDSTSLCIGFVAVAEYLEENGSHSIAVLHTDMAPWHMHGMLTYARDHHCSVESLPVLYLDSDDDYEE